MKEKRIISMVGLYGSLILSNTSERDVFVWLYLVLAVCWLSIHIYYILKQKR